MAVKTPHFEFYSDVDNIMIYGIDIKEVFPDGVNLTPDICDQIDVLIPDIMVKSEVATYGKKGIMLYSMEKKILHVKYVMNPPYIFFFQYYSVLV